MFARISPKSSGGRWLRLMLALLGEVPPGNCQQFIDKGDWTRELSGLRGQSICDIALAPALTLALRAVTGPLNWKA
jgi:hypothetical protein